MPMNSLPTAILAHMVAINNVPPPPLRSIPGLKLKKTINYGQLNALCHIRGLQSRHSSLNLTAHNTFIKQYPQIFLREKTTFPKISQLDLKRKCIGKTDQKIPQPDESHNIAVYARQARGGPSLYEEEEKAAMKFVEFLAIVKKLPVHRTVHEHKTVWRMLKKIPVLASQLSDEHLKILSKKVISEVWIKGSTVIGDDGLYVILKGQARPHVKVLRSLTKDTDSLTSSISRDSLGFDAKLRDSTLAELYLPSKEIVLRKWSTFGSLEVAPETEVNKHLHSVVTEDDCEILKIPAKEYEKLKLEKIKRQNMQKLKLIRKCPFYENWPTLTIYELVSLSKWKNFPPGHVLVESGTVISFVGFINSGYCNIYRNVVGLVRLRLNKVKKVKKLVYMGKLKEKESFGEISILLQNPFSCTIITGEEVEMMIIEDKDILG